MKILTLIHLMPTYRKYMAYNWQFLFVQAELFHSCWILNYVTVFYYDRFMGELFVIYNTFLYKFVFSITFQNICAKHIHFVSIYFIQKYNLLTHNDCILLI